MPTLATEDGLPEILGPVPAPVEAELATLRASLDAHLPAKKVGKNALVGTWNIRAFGDMSETWERGAKDEPKRNMADVLAIAEIVSRFDVVAIQEARANLKALRHMLKALGPDWGLILTDVNPPPAGNGERLAFVFDTRRAKASGLAAELVVPDEWLREGKVAEGALREQFVRTPYSVSFMAGSQTFILTTLHVIYGADADERTGELRAIAEWLADWAKRTSEDYHQNLIVLGDFNIDREGDPNYEALTSTGLQPPAELRTQPRTIFDSEDDRHFYDQIAWFTERGAAQLTLRYEGAGHADSFNWTEDLLTAMGSIEKSWHISDHFPLWVEFSLEPTP
jgi:endonuclease/exonuclease/phosphatase family metal-dependent hydrolase